MSYSINIRRSAQKSLAGIAQPHRNKIIEQIKYLTDNPRPVTCKKLTGREAWRIRIGAYRVIDEINDNQLDILVVNIAHRSKVYK